MSNPLDSFPFLWSGLTIKMLKIGPLIENPKDHPLYAEALPSYVRQGHLRDCLCDCGKRKLIPEDVLITGRVKSCGCLRARMRQMSQAQKNDLEALAAEWTATQKKLKEEQFTLAALKTVQIPFRNDKEITRVAEQIRGLLTYKQELTEKIRANKLKNNGASGIEK